VLAHAPSSATFPLPLPISLHHNWPHNAFGYALATGQEQQRLLNIRCQILQVHDLREASLRDAAFAPFDQESPVERMGLVPRVDVYGLWAALDIMGAARLARFGIDR